MSDVRIVDVVEVTPARIGEGVTGRRALLASIIAGMLRRAVEDGRWEMLPDGRLVPAQTVDIERMCVVE